MTKEPAPPASHGPRQGAGAHSRARLIEIATALFRHGGVRSASVDDIVNVAGLSKPTFYRRFAAKDDLVVACLVQESRRVRAELGEMLTTVAPAAPARIRAIGRYYAETFSGTPRRGLFLFNLAVEYPNGEGPVGQAIAAEIRLMRETLATWLVGLEDPHQGQVIAQLSLTIIGAGAVCQALGCPGDSLIEAVEAIAVQASPHA